MKCSECAKKAGYREWCKQCLIDNLRKNFTNWTSGNEKIDNFIQGMQLKIDSCYEIVFEWIPYDHFDDFEKIGGLTKICLAVWKDGPLRYDSKIIEYTRNHRKVALK